MPLLPITEAVLAARKAGVVTSRDIIWRTIRSHPDVAVKVPSRGAMRFRYLVDIDRLLALLSGRHRPPQPPPAAPTTGAGERFDAAA